MALKIVLNKTTAAFNFCVGGRALWILAMDHIEF